MASALVALEQEYDIIVTNLQGINESLNKITGNQPPKTNEIRDYKKIPNYDRININHEEALSEEDNDQHILNSAIIQVKKPVKSREEFINKQGNLLSARNKRMFGHLLGTLNQFKKESDDAKEKQKALIRSEIEKKLDERAVNERQTLIQEKKSLYTQKNYAKNKLKLLQLKIDMLKMQEAWEDNQNHLKNYIKTSIYPTIYYIPNIMSSEMKVKLEESAKSIEDEIHERRELIETELKKLEDNEELLKDDNNLGQVNQNISELVNNEHNLGDNDISRDRPDHFNNDKNHPNLKIMVQTGLSPSSGDFTQNASSQLTSSTTSRHIEIKCDFGQSNGKDGMPTDARKRNVILGRNNNLIAFQAKRDIERKIKELEKRKISARCNAKRLRGSKSRSFSPSKTMTKLGQKNSIHENMTDPTNSLSNNTKDDDNAATVIEEIKDFEEPEIDINIS